MSTHEEHIELFDRYLADRLEGAEKASFENRLELDKVFAEEFKVHKILALGIRDHGRSELKAYLQSHRDKLHGGMGTNIRQLSFAIAAVLVLFIGVYAVMTFYVQPGKKNDIALESKQSAPAPSADSTVPPMAGKYEPEKQAMLKEESAADMAEVAPVPADANMAPPAPIMVQPESNTWTYGSGEGAGTADKDRIFDFEDVKSEKKLKDTMYIAQVLHEDLYAAKDDEQKTTELDAAKPEQRVEMANATSTNTRAKGYTNKTAKLPAMSNNVIVPDSKNRADTVSLAASAKAKEESSKKLYNNDLSKRSIHAEFWQSPVNFKGYKYTGNTVYFYGLSAETVRLFVYKDQIYLRTGGQVYLITPCQDGCPYKAVEDKTITEFILKQA